jgi:hypothetical protein
MNTVEITDNENQLDGILKPMIYSKKAIWGFSIFFSPLFGGVLLMQNLKDTDRRKEGNLILLISIALTALTIAVVTVFDIKGRTIPFLFNLGGAALLTEYFYKKYFPDEIDYEKKKIWKPLFIALAICIALIAFTFFSFYAQDQAV